MRRSSFDEVVHGVQEDVCEELAREIPDWETPGPKQGQEVVAREEHGRRLGLQHVLPAVEDDGHEIERPSALHDAPHRLEQDLVVHRGEEASDVGPEAPAHPTGEAMGTMDGRVRALPLATGVGVAHEAPLEERLESADDGVVDDAVPERRRGDQAPLRLRHHERAVAPRPVGATAERGPQPEDLALEIVVERRRAGGHPARSPRQPPGAHQGVERGDSVEEVRGRARHGVGIPRGRDHACETPPATPRQLCGKSRRVLLGAEVFLTTGSDGHPALKMLGSAVQLRP